MKLKNGGANKLQPYNPDNGEYIDKEESIKTDSYYKKYYSLNSETVKLFKKNNWKFEFPNQHMHDFGYAKFYLKHIVDVKNVTINEDKLLNYLLIYKIKDNKNYLINDLGYYAWNVDLLKNDILNNTDFTIRTLSYFKSKTYTFLSPTKLYNNILRKPFYCYTVWQVDDKNSIHFVSIMLSLGGKYEKN